MRPASKPTGDVNLDTTETNSSMYMASLDICHKIFTDSGCVLNMGMGITHTLD